jgi:hypothetical protein
MNWEDTVVFQYNTPQYARYNMASETQPGVRYVVLIGFTTHPNRCSCPAGARNLQCKHLKVVLQRHNQRTRQAALRELQR